MQRFRQLSAGVLAIGLAIFSAHGHAQGTALLNIVFVLDGLRPDAINAADTPVLYKLRTEGVNFTNSHSVFPTVTRVNATSLGTGTYPARHGIMSNNIYVPDVNATAAFSNDSMRNLLKMDEVTGGKTVMATTLSEMLESAGRKMVVVSSGSSGGAFLLAPKAPQGIGVLIHAESTEQLPVAYPAAIAAEITRRFGAPPKKGGARDHYTASVDWTMRVLGDYVLPELKPQVIFAWLTEPDHTQHAFGSNAPETVATIRNDDRQLGVIFDRLQALDLRDKTNIMVVSDHGFSHSVYGVNVRQELREAGFVPGVESEDVVIASSGQAVLLHVKNRDPVKIAEIATFLKMQPWCGVLFTAAGATGPAHLGRVPGTFSLELIHLGGNPRSADIVLTFPWSSAANRFGAAGTDYQLVSVGSRTGPMDGTQSNHGSMSPWTVRNTMFAWGPDFKRGITLRTPSANVDVAPTVLHLTGVRSAGALDGRVLREALAGGPDEEKLMVETRTLRVEEGVYRAALQITETSGKRYIDKSWRE